MEIKLHNIPIKEVVDKFVDNEEEGVYGYHGNLNIRPKYQREFVYDLPEEQEVIYTILKGYPLNIMYWVDTEDGKYEVLDGQQRTLSICKFVNGEFSILKDRKADKNNIQNICYYNNLTKDQQDKFLNYTLSIYICKGTDSEKLEWFNVVNIAGKELTRQEIRNAIYSGQWVTDAKRYFSKTNSAGYVTGKDYLSGEANRQIYLETALKWISDRDKIKIEDYMAKHQHDEDANALWQYFQSVIDWVKRLFPNTRKEMKKVDWGYLYNRFKDKEFNSNVLEQRVKELMMDDDVTKREGIYPYLITGEEKYLNIREFSDAQKREAYEAQEGICKKCLKHFTLEEMHADHITPWSKGGKTSIENCQMLCADCNRRKSNI